MPYVDHSDFTKKLDNNSKVWRYMDFVKSVDLLERKKQYFVSGSKLQKIDPFEGFFQKTNIVDPEFDEWDRQQIEQRDTKERYEDPKSVFINCWHINELESDAMWKIFATINTGIAIQTTIKKLKKSFHSYHRPVYIRKVRYGDTRRKALPFLGFHIDSP